MWERAGDHDCSCSDPVHTCKVLANIPFVLCYAIHNMTLSSRWAPLGPEGLLSILNVPVSNLLFFLHT